MQLSCAWDFTRSLIESLQITTPRTEIQAIAVVWRLTKGKHRIIAQMDHVENLLFQVHKTNFTITATTINLQVNESKKRLNTEFVVIDGKYVNRNRGWPSSTKYHLVTILSGHLITQALQLFGKRHIFRSSHNPSHITGAITLLKMGPNKRVKHQLMSINWTHHYIELHSDRPQY